MAVNQLGIEQEYEEGFEQLSNREKRAFYECFSVDRAGEYAEAAGEVLVEAPSYWELETKGFKKVVDPSAQTTYNIIEGILEEKGIEISYYPDASSLSLAYSSLFKITGEEFEEATSGKGGGYCGKNRNYDAKSFSQEHWDAIQEILE